MIRWCTCLLVAVACHGSTPPAESEPGGPPAPPIDPDTEPSTLPPEPNSPSDPQTMAPTVGAAAKTDPAASLPAHTGGDGGTGGMGGLSGTGGSAPVKR